MTTQRLEGPRKWLKEGGFSFEATRHNIGILKEAIPNVIVVEEREETAVQNTAICEYAPPDGIKSMSHQVVGIERFFNSPRENKKVFAIFAEVGTGKTHMAVTIAGQMYCRGEIDAVLVFAPNGVHQQWVNEQIPIHLGVDHNTTAWPVHKDHKFIQGAGLSFFAINWESARAPKGIQKINEFISFFRGRILVVADESHKIKNKESSTWNTTEKMSKRCSHKLELTGTPLGVNFLDVWAQIMWLDPNIIGIHYKKSFINEYCILGGYDGDIIVGTKNVERFRSLIDPYIYTVTKKDIGHPDPIHDRWVFDPTKEQIRLIKEIKKELIAQIDDGRLVSAANGAVAAMRMQQISGGWFTDEDGNVQRLFTKWQDNPRQMNLSLLCENYDGPLIIWARYHTDIEMIVEVLGEENCAQYHGKIKDEARKDSIDDFLSGRKKYFVGTPASGGTGLNLQGKCLRSVFYSCDDNYITKVQAEGRIDRIGAEGIITHTALFCRKSSDGMIYNRHKKKSLFSDMAIGDFRKMLASDDDAFDSPVVGKDDGGW